MKLSRYMLALTALLVAAFATQLIAKVEVGQKPEIKWKTVDDQAITSQSLKGKIVLIDFWATWCPPCMQQVPHMKELHAKYADKNVVTIGVSLDRDVEKMKKVAKEKEMNWPMVWSPKGADKPIAGEWGVNAIPQCFILSPEGEVIWAGHPALLDKPLADAVEKYGNKE